MLDPTWFLVMASALAVIGGVLVYKQSVSQLAECASEEEFLSRRPQAYLRFFVKFVVVEFVSLPFLIYGMYQIVSGMAGSTDVTYQLLAVVLTLLFGVLSVYFTSSQIVKDPNVSDMMKKYAIHHMILGLGLIHAFPVVSLAFLFGALFGLY